MRCTDHAVRLRAAVREDDSSVFVALELSRSAWLIAASHREARRSATIVLQLPMSLLLWLCWLG